MAKEYALNLKRENHQRKQRRKARLRKLKLEIEIDEAYIAELVSQEIARRIVETHGGD